MPVSSRLSRRARSQAPVRSLLATAAIAIAALVVGCFPAGSGGSLSTHHNDPFLTCVRQRESGGNYRVDSPGGQYHGAYQFLQSTWDATARHIGAFDRVGMDPHTASPTMQDDFAWALYQWQGTRPWAGNGCA
ncbi:MAG TPA: transglycosylase family protein [Acidimicrobiia bacterium]|nr:transglycosylase family protein [Acidimicrobiia bacterium]